jgi:hypothetical protein
MTTIIIRTTLLEQGIRPAELIRGNVRGPSGFQKPTLVVLYGFSAANAAILGLAAGAIAGAVRASLHLTVFRWELTYVIPYGLLVAVVWLACFALMRQVAAHFVRRSEGHLDANLHP